MKRLRTKIKAFLDSLLLTPVRSSEHNSQEEFIRTIFECLRNIALCALVLGVGAWLYMKSLLPPFYQKFVPELLFIISGVFLGLNLLYFDMRLRKLKFPRIVWFLLMLIFFALSFFLYFMLVISR